MPASPEVAVCIGRFQPFHNGHLAWLRQTLACTPRCLVVLGSSFRARTPQSPWSWQERAEMIRLALPETDRERLAFLPLRDYHDEARWRAALAHGIASNRPAGAGRGWRRMRPADGPPIDAARLRDALFAAEPGRLEASLGALVDQLPPSTLAFLRAWSAGPHWPALAEAWWAMKRYHADWARLPAAPVFVTVDALVCCAGHVLLIRRGQPPGQGLLALPGGFIDVHESACRSAMRELREETSLDLPYARLEAALRGVEVFDDPQRSQRGRTITHVHHFELDGETLPAVQAADDALAADWVAIERLPALEDQFHDDHFQILDQVLSVSGHSTNPRPAHPPDPGRA